MHYVVYQITNRLNGKIYIGKHQTKKLNDGYMGSGKLIILAIKKYGIENFTKEILFNFDNEADMNAKEAELVTEEFCLREDTYNICPGGHGGFGYINLNGLNLRSGMSHTLESREKISKSRQGKKHSADTKKKLSENNWAKTNSDMHKRHISSLHIGKTKTEQHKEKISNKLKNKKKEIIECPYCNTIGAKPIMNRWHFNNCKARV